MRGGKALALIGLVGILAATMYPSPTTAEASNRTPLLCVVCGSDGGVDVLLNIILFLPFALGLRLSGVRAWKVILISALLSLCVEAIQFAGVPGRDASLSDVLTNTSGGVLGAVGGPIIPAALFPTPRIAKGLLWLGSAFTLLTLSLTAWLMTPWVPAEASYSHWAPDGPALDPFQGKVTEVATGAVTLPNGRLADSADHVLKRMLREETLDLAVQLVSGPPPDVRTWIYLVEAGQLVLPLLRQEGTSLYFAVPTRSVRFRLRAPTLALDDGLPQSSGVRVMLNAVESKRRLRVTSSYQGKAQSSDVQLSPAQGWMLIAAFGITLDRHESLITGLYLALLLLPLGYWASQTAAPRQALAILAGLLALGLGLVPFGFGYPPVPWHEWAAALAGATAGWALYRPAAYLETRCVSPSISEFSSS